MNPRPFHEPKSSLNRGQLRPWKAPGLIHEGESELKNDYKQNAFGIIRLWVGSDGALLVGTLEGAETIFGIVSGW